MPRLETNASGSPVGDQRSDPPLSRGDGVGLDPSMRRAAGVPSSRTRQIAASAPDVLAIVLRECRDLPRVWLRRIRHPDVPNPARVEPTGDGIGGWCGTASVTPRHSRRIVAPSGWRSTRSRTGWRMATIGRRKRATPRTGMATVRPHTALRRPAGIACSRGRTPDFTCTPRCGRAPSGVRGRSRVRDPARPVLRAESRRAGAADV
jgi:hypothetical protein